MVDKSLVFDGDTFDIQYQENGDVVQDGLETSIYMAIFGNNRADLAEVSRAELRQGFFGTVFGEDSGSKVWLDSGLKTFENLNRIVDYARKSLQFLIDKAIVKQIDVDGEFTDIGISLNIRLTFFDNAKENMRLDV